jgi:hypothetical protein
MCDLSNIAVVCSEHIECFTAMASKFFFKPFVTIPVAPIITGIIIYLMFHIRRIAIRLIFYFLLCFLLLTFLSAGIATSITYMLFLLLITISGLFAVTSLSVFTPRFHNTATSLCSLTGFAVCVCVHNLSVVSMPSALHIE